MMAKAFHINGLLGHWVILYHLIFLLATLNSVWGGILIYDGDLGIEEFRDVELSNTEAISKNGIMGAIVAASPVDACSNISKPPDFNVTMNWFVLIAGNSCSFEVKVLNAKYAGYAVAVIYISETRIPHFIRTNNGYSFFPNISAVVIGSDPGRRIRENYLFEINERFRVYIFPNNTFSIMTFLLLFSIVTGLFLVVMLVFAVIRFFQHSSSVQRGRLSSRHLKQLQTSTYNKGDGSDSCAICLEEYKDQEKLRFLPCSHGYHARCIDPWLTNNRPICPVCKQKVVLRGHNSDNAGDSDFDERSETTPLLQDRRETQHGTFNLIYNPAGENVGDLNLPSTSVSKNIGRVRVLRQSISSSGGVDSSNNYVAENLSGNNTSIDSAPENIGIIKRLVFVKNSSEYSAGSSVTGPSTSSSASLSAADHIVRDLPDESTGLNTTDVDLSKNSIVGVDLSNKPGPANIGDVIIVSNSSLPENFPRMNLSSDSAVTNVGDTNLPGETITGYVAGMNLSEFWPSDYIDKIKSSNDSLSRNQDGLNISRDVINLSSETNVNLGGRDVSSKSATIGEINLPNKPMSVNLDSINLSGKVDVTNLGNVNVSTNSVAANIGDMTAIANSGRVNVLNILNRSDFHGNIEKSESDTANFEAVNASKSPIAPNHGIDLPGQGLTANLDGSNIISSVSLSSNLEGVNVLSPSMIANLGGVNVLSPSISANLGGVNVSSPSISANLGGVNTSSYPISAKLVGVNVSSPPISEYLGGVNVSSPPISGNLGDINVSSPSVSTNLGVVNVSSPSVSANLGVVNVSSTSVRANLGGVNVSSFPVALSKSCISVTSPSPDTSLRGINISSPSIATSLGTISVSSDIAPPNLGVSVSSDVVPPNRGIRVLSDVAPPNLGIRVSSDIAPPNHGIRVSSDVATPNLGIGQSSDVAPKNLGISVSRDVVPTNLGINVSSDVTSPNLGISVSSDVAPPNLGISESSDVAQKNLGISVSRDVAPTNVGINVSSDVASTNLGISVSSDVAPTNLGINLSSGSANRRRRRNFK